MKKNISYLTYEGGTAAWQFYIDSEIAESDAVPEQTASIVERAFGILDSEIVPVSLRLGVATIPAQTPLRTALDEIESLSDSNIVVEDQHRVTFEKYAERLADIPLDDRRVLHNAKVSTTATKVRVFLRSGMKTIDPEESPHYRYDSPDAEGTPDIGPLGFSILHLWPHYGPEEKIDGESIYRISVLANSNLWLDDTPIATINRTRLQSLLHEIDDAFPVVKRKFTVDDMKGYGDADAEALFNYDGPPAEELIREYRIDWVESELVETAAQYNEGDETIFEVTSDAESVQTAELRLRIEAYVDQQQTKGNAPQADRLRIIRTDGTPLEARFSDGDIRWIDDEADQQ